MRFSAQGTCRRIGEAAGYTLVELMIVLIILGSLLAAVAPSFQRPQDSINDTNAKTSLALAIRSARADALDTNGNFGSANDIAATIPGGQDGLSASVGDCPADAAGQPSTQVVVDQSSSGGAVILCKESRPGRVVVLTYAGNQEQYAPLLLSGLPTVASPPEISGSAVEGQTLTVSSGSWNGGVATLAYQWMRDVTNIPGATGPTYELQNDDVGHTLTVKVTATNVVGDGEGFAEAVGPISPAPAASITVLSPSSATAGSGPITLQVTGTGFQPGDVVNWNGAPLPTTYLTHSYLQTTIGAAQLASSGTFQLTVTHVSGAISAAVPYVVSP